MKLLGKYFNTIKNGLLIDYYFKWIIKILLINILKLTSFFVDKFLLEYNFYFFKKINKFFLNFSKISNISILKVLKLFFGIIIYMILVYIIIIL